MTAQPPSVSALESFDHMRLYEDTCFDCSKLITQNYSTSFSMGIRSLDKRFHAAIYGIYGYVRFADEIVDTFHKYPKRKLLERFKKETYVAIEEGISLNPVLQSFQQVVRQYNIERELIDAFLWSMEMDLDDNSYDQSLYDTYIYGSAEVVGLMCLRVFCEGDDAKYQKLLAPARSLGSAFQKVNFLRDMRSDKLDRGRVYFPGVSYERFDLQAKKAIEADIQKDFDHALEGIKNLPDGARFGVYTAYRYYLELFDKIRKSTPEGILMDRIRVPNPTKVYLLMKSMVKQRFNLI